jgi:hypothetical protein
VSSPAEYQAEVDKAGDTVEITYLDSRGSPVNVTLKGK